MVTCLNCPLFVYQDYRSVWVTGRNFMIPIYAVRPFPALEALGRFGVCFSESSLSMRLPFDHLPIHVLSCVSRKLIVNLISKTALRRPDEWDGTHTLSYILSARLGLTPLCVIHNLTLMSFIVKWSACLSSLQRDVTLDVVLPGIAFL